MSTSEVSPPAEIVSVGLVTPVGLYAGAASAAIAAGRSRAMRGSVVNKALEGQGFHLVDEAYLEPLTSALSADNMSLPHERMVRLGGSALAEAASAARGPVPLLLALPELIPGRDDAIGPSFVQHLALQAGASVRIDEKRSAVYRRGGASALFALRDALLLLGRGEVPELIVGGVDTFLDAVRLSVLDLEDRLYGRESRLGFLPGEGAAFLLLRSSRARARVPKQGQPPAPPEGQSLARIISVGTGKETGHRYSAEPYRGDGLAEAFETLFDAVPSNQPKVRCVYAGFNGEEMPAKEWGVARLRNSERFADEVQVEHPADCIGDSGAAMGAIMLALAALAISGGHTPEPRPIWARDDPGPTVVWSTSDRELRAAALLQW